MNKKFFTIPNILTLIRIALIPFFIVVFVIYFEQRPYLPAVICIIIGLTDMLDGFIAKKFNMITDAGKVLDPFADKLFLNTVLLCFVLAKGGLIITILLIINVIKEMYMIIAGTLLYKRKVIFGSKFIGKAASFVLNCGVIIYFFISYSAALETVSNILFLTGLALSLSAAVYYTVAIYKQTGGKLPPKS